MYQTGGPRAAFGLLHEFWRPTIFFYRRGTSRILSMSEMQIIKNRDFLFSVGMITLFILF